MNRSIYPAIVAALCVGVCYVLLARVLSGNNGPPSNPKPYVQEVLKHNTHETELTRTYRIVDKQVERVDIRFADGSSGRRFLKVGADGKRHIDSAFEFHDDRSQFIFGFDEKGKMTSVIGCRPDGTQWVKEGTLPDGKTTQRVFYGPDGSALQATLALGEADYVFNVFEGRAGHERLLYTEEYSEPTKPIEWDGGKPTYIITTTVYADGPTPAYRQVWYGFAFEDEGGGGGGKLSGNNSNGQEQIKLFALEYFHEDTLLVRQRVVFDVSFDLSGQQESGGTAVHVLDKSGKETSVRYLTNDNQVVKTIDKTKTPELTIVTPKASALSETFDAEQRKSPVSEAMAKLRDDVIMNGIGYLHLDRLLAD
jgi:hypothetical protein